MNNGTQPDLAHIDAVIRDAIAGHRLVLVDRFASAGRNAYTGPLALPSLRPVLGLACYAPWATAGPLTAVTLEGSTGVRSQQTKHDFLPRLGEHGREALRRLGKPPLVAAWYETEELLDLARPLGGRLLTVPRSTRDTIENKTTLDTLLQQAGITPTLRIPSESYAQTLPSFHSLAGRFGLPFVVQANSSGGRGTMIVQREMDFARADSLHPPFRVSRFVEGLSSNTTVLNVPDGRGGCAVYVDIPSHKAIHIPDVGIGPAKGAGNDWSLQHPPRPLHHLIDAAVQIGTYAFQQYGLVGLWGIDSIWFGEAVVINELNCRNQGTTEVSGINQMLRGFPPFFAAHVALHAGAPVDWLPSADEFNTETLRRGSSVDGRAPFYLKIRNRSEVPVRATRRFQGSGVYRLTSDNDLEWLRSATHTLEADADADEILVANAPLYSTVCLPGTELCTMEGVTTGRHIFEDPDKLSPYAARLARAMYKHVEPAEHPEGVSP